MKPDAERLWEAAVALCAADAETGHDEKRAVWAFNTAEALLAEWRKRVREAQAKDEPITAGYTAAYMAKHGYGPPVDQLDGSQNWWMFANDAYRWVTEVLADNARMRAALEQMANVDYFSQPQGEPFVQLARRTLRALEESDADR